MADMTSLLMPQYIFQCVLSGFHVVMFFLLLGHLSYSGFTVFDTQWLPSNGPLLSSSIDTEFYETLLPFPVPSKWEGLFQVHCQVYFASLRLTFHVHPESVMTDNWQTGRMDGRREQSNKKTSKEALSTTEGGLNHISNVSYES